MRITQTYLTALVSPFTDNQICLVFKEELSSFNPLFFRQNKANMTKKIEIVWANKWWKKGNKSCARSVLWSGSQKRGFHQIKSKGRWLNDSASSSNKRNSFSLWQGKSVAVLGLPTFVIESVRRHVAQARVASFATADSAASLVRLALLPLSAPFCRCFPSGFQIIAEDSIIRKGKYIFIFILSIPHWYSGLRLRTTWILTKRSPLSRGYFFFSLTKLGWVSFWKKPIENSKVGSFTEKK